MLLDKPLPFIEDFINELNKGLKSYKPDGGLNRIQRGWIGFCLMGIILTNSVCWARFERVSLGKYKLRALSWMFRKSKIPWEMMLQVSIAIVLKQYGISEGTLVTDDSDHKRSKKTPRLFKSHKIRDKGSGGYINGQNWTLDIFRFFASQIHPLANDRRIDIHSCKNYDKLGNDRSCSFSRLALFYH
jgi:hypothetical protein